MRGTREEAAAELLIAHSSDIFLTGKEVQLPFCKASSCAVVSRSCAMSAVIGSSGKSLPLPLCPSSGSQPPLFLAKSISSCIVKCVQLESVNSLGAKINCSFWQTISLPPRISWLCVARHRGVRARRLFPAAGVGFTGQKPPTLVGKEMPASCRQRCTASP